MIKTFAAAVLAAAAGTSSSAALADGEIRFQVKDPAMLERVKAGDKVKFQAEKVGGAFTITQLEPK